MKKVLLLSVVASTIIMAGGDIAPVEPIVVPVVESGWKFDGNMVAYYQTQDDNTPSLSLFGTDASQNNFGIQLRAVNDDLFWGLGAGFEVTGMSSSSLIADGAIQTAGFYNNGTVNGNTFNNIGGALTQAYLTYTISAIDTSLKIGRQTLPKSLSPFAFSEEWQPVKNTFDAALVVNSSIPDTTLVYAFVDKANLSMGNLGSFNTLNLAATGGSNGVHMITAQNKSIEGLILTGSFYYGQELLGGAANDTMMAWGDAKFAYDGYSIGLQGGMVQDKDVLATQNDTTVAYGAKIGAKFNLFDTDFSTCLAYSGVNDGAHAIQNYGTGVKTPLYTQMILNQNAIKLENQTFVAKVGADVLGGHFGIDFDYTINQRFIVDNSFAAATDNKYMELDVSYKTKVTDNTELFAAYVYTKDDSVGQDARNFVRVWARYNFN